MKTEVNGSEIYWLTRQYLFEKAFLRLSLTFISLKLKYLFILFPS